MRVITEEMLQLIEDQEDDKDFPFNNYGLKEILSKYLVEIDQLTVTKLRPMSDAPLEGIMVDVITKSQSDLGIFEFREAWNSYDEIWRLSSDDENRYTIDDLVGWIPRPTYKPSQP